MITIQQETYASVREEIEPLLERHWREVANHQKEIPLEPNWEIYQQMEEKRKLVVVGARREGALVGYAVFFLYPHVHYKSCLVAANDVIFLDKPERGGRSGLRLILTSEELLHKLGVRKITWHVKPAHDFSPLLQRLGYMQEEFVMGKLLGE